jgi:hypothetical protein
LSISAFHGPKKRISSLRKMLKSRVVYEVKELGTIVAGHHRSWAPSFAAWAARTPLSGRSQPRAVLGRPQGDEIPYNQVVPERRVGTPWAETEDVATTTGLPEALVAHMLDTLEADERGFEIDELSKEGSSA